MTQDEKKKLYAALAAPFPEEAIERTDGKQTGRGYNTTGLKVQFVIDRLNAVLGIGGWRVHREVTVREISTSSGRRAYEAWCDLILELGEWADDKFHVFAESLAYGGHVAMLEGDARKGSFSNALKRAAAMHGCGAAAYRGQLDDDSVPQEAPAEPAAPLVPPPAQVRPGPTITPVSSQRPPAPPRSRLSSKQLAAIWAIGRKLGYEQQPLRQHIKSTFGVQPEFLSREQASQAIGALSAQTGNGHDAGEQRAPGMEG
jgi:hypothetical protein